MDLKELIKQWIKLDYIVPEDIPTIELYMDQITTFMDTHLSGSKRFPEDKTLTKTMINNYTKNNLMPPPNKKKYTKNHIFLLIYIYYFKNILSIMDIQNLLNPLIDGFYTASEKETTNFSSIYQNIFDLEHIHHYEIKASIEKTVELSRTAFKDADYKDQEFLQNFALISLLSYDIFMKKQLVERMIDNLYTPDDPKKNSEKKSKDI